MGKAVVAIVIGSVCRVAFVKGFGGMAELRVFDMASLNFDDKVVSADYVILYHAYTFDGPVFFKLGAKVFVLVRVAAS